MADKKDTHALALSSSSLPEAVSKRHPNVLESQWLTLCNSLFPGARGESVLMVLDYCASRKLDPMKKPCHIVPMRVKNARSGDYEWRDVVMPGIYEYRVTANRTALYLGHSEPVYGPEIQHAGVTAPAWCSMTMFRWHPEAKVKVEFPVKVFFKECCVVKDKDNKANDRWSKAPIQMLTKCTEAAGLREAFPDELGGEHTAEEMEGVVIETVEPVVDNTPKPAQRVSEKAPEPVVEAEVVKEEPKEEPKPEPKSPEATAVTSARGKIARAAFRDKGSIIALDNGFLCGTHDDQLFNEAARLKDLYKDDPDTAPTVELTVRPPREPGKVPMLKKITVMEAVAS